MNIKNKITKKTLKTMEKIVGPLTLAKLLWSIRMSEEMSQAEFAKKLGLSKQHLCDIEHGRKNVSPKLAVEYAKKLGYAPEQFIRLALQDLVDRAKLDVIVNIEPKFAYAHIS
jgi:DNA-binding XRE family transcriptional regulator